jgi:hypothetical protein
MLNVRLSPSSSLSESDGYSFSSQAIDRSFRAHPSPFLGLYLLVLTSVSHNSGLFGVASV